MVQGAKVTLGMAKGSMTDGRHAREHSTAAKDPDGRGSSRDGRRVHGVEFTSNQQILRKEMQQTLQQPSQQKKASVHLQPRTLSYRVQALALTLLNTRWDTVAARPAVGGHTVQVGGDHRRRLRGAKSCVATTQLWTDRKHSKGNGCAFREERSCAFRLLVCSSFSCDILREKVEKVMAHWTARQKLSFLPLLLLFGPFQCIAGLVVPPSVVSSPAVASPEQSARLLFIPWIT